MIEQRDAFVVGVSCFAKLAGFDRSDTRELIRLLFMESKSAQPVLKAAADIQLARCSEKAGDQLVKLGTTIKAASALGGLGVVSGWLGKGLGWLGGGGGGGSGGVAASAVSPGGGRNVETGAKSPEQPGLWGSLGKGLGSWLGVSGGGGEAAGGGGKNVETGAKTPAEQWQAYTQSQAAPMESPADIFRRKHPTFSGDYETVKDVPAVRQMIEAEQKRTGGMTPGQIHLKRWGRQCPST
ncbi:hypothetical protein LCGC14_0557990 [marine sediment metagenome]|uniref:Uncharacterized protein n=1 Tax=marine sediment metagenome TaxID=412755 RepID=A0A0F9U9E2_9ZZZZ